MSVNDKNPDRGFPVYADPVNRKIVDASGDEEQKGEWHPVNGPAQRLCRCIEGLRDIQEAIENYKAVHAAKKQRRRLRGIFIPLHALCVCVVELINSIQSESGIHASLPQNCPKDLTKLRDQFAAMVPYSSKGKLGMLRNKASGAHYDKDLSPVEVRDLVKSVTPAEVGGWINICLGTICDLLKLKAYRWGIEAPADDTAVIFCEEDIPVLSVVDVDLKTNRITGLRGIYLTKSPRQAIFELIKEVAKSADTLFEEGAHYSYRISSFYEDPPNVGWSAMLRAQNSS